LREAAAAKIAELDAAKKERDALAHAVTVATGHTNNARVRLTTVAHRAHANRIAKLLEKLLSTAVRLEGRIPTSVDLHRTIVQQIPTLKSSWPRDELPPLEIFSKAGLTAAIQEHTYKISAVIDPQVAMATTQYPGSRCFDMRHMGQPEQLSSLSDSIDI